MLFGLYARCDLHLRTADAAILSASCTRLSSLLSSSSFWHGWRWFPGQVIVMGLPDSWLGVACHYGERRLLNALFIALVSLSAISSQQLVVHEEDQLQYCSFFNNRAPKAQPGLQNCTWFKENSCCLQQEIEATFGRVKPLKGASPACQRYINYLMCYICAPNQNIFYQKERLTVCEEFCNRWYGACSNAILKGSIIGELYESGTEFCRSRRFLVNNENCFYFDITMDTTSSGLSISNRMKLFSCVICLIFLGLVI